LRCHLQKILLKITSSASRYSENVSRETANRLFQQIFPVYSQYCGNLFIMFVLPDITKPFFLLKYAVLLLFPQLRRFSALYFPLSLSNKENVSPQALRRS